MKIKTLMIITAVITVLFGLAFIFIPVRFLELYGSDTVNESMKYVGQLFGSALFTFAVLTWSARNSPDNEARKAIALAFCLGHTTGFVVALIAQFGGAVNALGWSTVAVYFLIAIGFGYFRFAKSSS